MRGVQTVSTVSPVGSANVTPRTARIALAALLLGIYSTLAIARDISNAIRDAGLLRLTIGAAFGVAALAIGILVARSPALRRPRTLLAVLGVAGVYAAVVFPMSSSEEKFHFLEYGAVGLLAFLAAPVSWVGLRRFAFAAFFTLCAGWVDEGIQALLPTRHYDLRDVGFNALAGVMALGAFGLIRTLAPAPRGGADQRPE
jgi:hypothetical protein